MIIIRCRWSVLDLFVGYVQHFAELNPSGLIVAAASATGRAQDNCSCDTYIQRDGRLRTYASLLGIFTLIERSSRTIPDWRKQEEGQNKKRNYDGCSFSTCSGGVCLEYVLHTYSFILLWSNCFRMGSSHIWRLHYFPCEREENIIIQMFFDSFPGNESNPKSFSISET